MACHAYVTAKDFMKIVFDACRKFGSCELQTPAIYLRSKARPTQVAPPEEQSTHISDAIIV